MSDFHQWVNGNLVIDVDVLEPDGRVVRRRVTLEQERLATVIADNEDGRRFFMNRVMRRLRPLMNFTASTLQKAVKVPEVTKAILNQGSNVQADDLLPPQFLELEALITPPDEVPAYYFPVKV